MVTVDTLGKVRLAFLVKVKGIKRIAREQHLARNTVRGIVHGEALRARIEVQFPVADRHLSSFTARPTRNKPLNRPRLCCEE